MRFLVLILSLLYFANPTHAFQNEDWAVSLIPEQLKQKANAIVRLQESTLTLLENGKTQESVHFVVTILNEKGEQFANLVEFYDKYSSISGLEGVVYDQSGKKIRKLKFDEFYDFSAVSGFSIYEDNRVKVANAKVGDFPYTVEYRFLRKYKKFMTLPGWSIYPSYNVAVQKSTFSYITKDMERVKYRGNEKFNFVPVIKTEKGTSSVTWIVENLAAIDNESFSPYFTDVSPQLLLAPSDFEMDGYCGSNKSWKDFGNWSSKLCKDRDTLSYEFREKIKLLTINAKNDFEKAKILYEFMQNKVRYVSIQVGIGGWQPFSALVVEKYSYGDCKALTNYMKTLLDIVGIKSYYCLVKAGEDAPNINKSFVCSQFNHAFLMVPINNDTIYLECTSQIDPFGYNGTFTDDRDILVTDSLNSFIKHTNVYNRDQNKLIKKVNIKIEKNLNGIVEQDNSYIGLKTEKPRYLMLAKPDKQRDFILRNLDFKQVKISQLSYSEHKDIIPVINEKVKYSVSEAAHVTNNGSVILEFNKVALLTSPQRTTNRKSDVLIRRSEIEIDSINYEIPKELTFERLPVSGSIENDFGSYKLEVINQVGRISFIRTITWNKCKLSPDKYSKLVEFHSKINEMDRQVIILKPV